VPLRSGSERAKETHGKRRGVPDSVDPEILELNDVILKKSVVEVVVAVGQQDIQLLAMTSVEDGDQSQQVRQGVA